MAVKNKNCHENPVLHRAQAGEFLLKKIINIFLEQKDTYPRSKIWTISGHIIKMDGAVWTPWHFLQFCPFQLCSICFCHTVRKPCQVTRHCLILWVFFKSPHSCLVI